MPSCAGGSRTPRVITSYSIHYTKLYDTLPTGGTARFFSPLSVDDFVKKSSLIALSQRGLQQLGGDVVRIAELEGLEAHARSVSLRLRDLEGDA